jgi:hypothetical protein
VLFALLSLGDLATLPLTDGSSPPYAIAVLDLVLGLASLALVALVWRRPDRPLWPLIVLRVASALTAVPAFLVGNVPAPALVAAGAIVLLTALGVVLVARPAAEVAA